MDQNLKQRLVGASVIVALAVIFVPMLFDGKPVQGEHQVELRIPDKPDLPPLEKRSFTIDQPVSSQQSASEPAPTARIAMEAPIEPEPIKPVVAAEKTHREAVQEKRRDSDKAKASSESPKASQSDSAVSAKPVTRPGGESGAEKTGKAAGSQAGTRAEPASTNTIYRVKIGSFSQRANAEKVRGKLLLVKIPTAIAKDSTRPLFHVYSPEFTRKQAAQRYVSRVVTASRQGALGLGQPAIVSLNPTESQKISNQTAKAWVVQVGSFSKLENARKLRDKLRQQGYTAFTDKAASSGKTLYRVRVGPEVKRDKAEEIRKLLQKKLQIRGVVRPHELSDVME